MANVHHGVCVYPRARHGRRARGPARLRVWGALSCKTSETPERQLPLFLRSHPFFCRDSTGWMERIRSALRVQGGAQDSKQQPKIMGARWANSQGATRRLGGVKLHTNKQAEKVLKPSFLCIHHLSSESLFLSRAITLYTLPGVSLKHPHVIIMAFLPDGVFQPGVKILA
ncbi:hypothetical protein llap_10766 [Limosa lapponica baueri]|uniref:Uncharacterized protein n=1 Tax=Limosa lapponica baueri TaxID=1758121 RepID=A0A2I0TYM4_LIMLA|nr:hypothetical protein llap_10766 [Limosa lapponica baueri]